MHEQLPKFLLFTEPSGFGGPTRHGGVQWRFQLRDENGVAGLAAADREPGWTVERLALLAVVRGLEALDEPAQVVLVNPHRYVSRALQYGLDAWRELRWRWERFGQLVAVRNADLWQRVDHAMSYHRVTCRTMRVDSAHRGPKKPLRRKRRNVVQEPIERWQVA